MMSYISNSFSDLVPSIEWGKKEDNWFGKPGEVAAWIIRPSFLLETYLHEVGHAITAKTLYSNTLTHIRLYIYRGGIINYKLGNPSKIGQYFSERIREMIIVAAGPLVSVLYAVGLAALGNYSNSQWLKALSTGHLANQIGYASIGLVGKNLIEMGDRIEEGDYVKLKSLGLHPVFPVIGITALILKNF